MIILAGDPNFKMPGKRGKGNNFKKVEVHIELGKESQLLAGQVRLKTSNNNTAVTQALMDLTVREKRKEA